MVLQQNVFSAAFKSLFVEVVWDFAYFPVWWYTKGLAIFATSTVRRILEMGDHLALRLLLLNIFKPMFAQTDRTGRVISFFMRIVILIARSIYFFVYALLQFVLLLIWVALPALVAYRLVGIYLTAYA